MKDASIGRPRGSSTLEILLAFAVLTLTFTAVISVVFSTVLDPYTVLVP